jgi:hypothetical protein
MKRQHVLPQKEVPTGGESLYSKKKVSEKSFFILSTVEVNQHRKARRLAAAKLLEMVIREEMQPRLAINRWPIIETAEDENDLSVKIAMQALWHFEADEDRHQIEVFYLDAQLELLRQMANFLKQDRDLPNYMLTMYPLDHRPDFYRAHSLFDKRIFKNLKSAISPWYQVMRQVLGNFLER